MQTFGVILVLVLALGTLAFAWGLDVGGVLGLPNMGYLNGQLTALAEREGTSASPLRLAWGAEIVLWPWRQLGVGMEFFSASGGIRGREFAPQTCWAFGIALLGRLKFPVFGRPVSLQAGVGAYRAEAAGLISGSGWALGGGLKAAGPVFTWGGMNLGWRLGFRYLSVAAIEGEGGRIEPAGLPALDFSGPYLGVDFSWGG